MKAKLNKKFKAQAKTARIKAGGQPTTMERCADGPIADLKKKQDKAHLLFEKLNEVELPEEVCRQHTCSRPVDNRPPPISPVSSPLSPFHAESRIIFVVF